MGTVSRIVRNSDVHYYNSINQENRSMAHMTVFNQEHFLNQKFRKGSDKDVEALQGICKKYGIAGTVKNNLGVSQIKEEINVLSNKDFTGHKLFMCVLMTHGKENGMVSAYDDYFDHGKIIIYPIIRSKTLDRVRKIFVVVACRGSYKYCKQEEEHCEDVEDDTLISTRDGITYSNILMCYSTYDGHVSKRRSSGTFYIQTLCQLLKDEVDSDIHKILAMVNEKLSNDIQIPIFYSSMGSFNFKSLLTDTLLKIQVNIYGAAGKHL